MKRKDVLILLVPLVIVVILWVVFNIYHSFRTSTIPQDVNKQILFINPDFDLKTIEELKKREIIEPSYTFEVSEDQVEQGLSPLPTPTVTESNEGTNSARESVGGELSP
ncbi:MAG: hypothetical protein HY344_00295 [Candidatus Levybacteria bacterium]|nr:hypothetical protein [Candidatus Levybacteria bacterium]